VETQTAAPVRQPRDTPSFANAKAMTNWAAKKNYAKKILVMCGQKVPPCTLFCVTGAVGVYTARKQPLFFNSVFFLLFSFFGHFA
jgi:hypothetical protein